MQEDVPFPRFMLLRRSAIKKFYASKFRMSSTVLKAVFALAVLSCATADLQCNSSVGLENKELHDNLIHASSYRAGHNPHLGRLNNEVQKINETKTVWGAWCAKDANVNQYIQVDLGVVRNVTGVATQGYDYGAMATSYQIMYSVNGMQWFLYQENSTTKIFNGNNDRDSIVQHRFDRVLPTRFIRFNPLSWGSMICMRIEIYACEIPQTKVVTTKATTTEKPTTENIDRPVRTKQILKTHVENTKKETEYQESSTSMENMTYENQNNAGSLSNCPSSLLLACIIVLLNKFLN